MCFAPCPPAHAVLHRPPFLQHNINHYYRPVVIPDSQKDTGSNHAISAMKCAWGGGVRWRLRLACTCVAQHCVSPVPGAGR